MEKYMGMPGNYTIKFYSTVFYCLLKASVKEIF